MKWTLDEERRARDAERKRKERASETAEQREARLSKGRGYYKANREDKASYDRAYREANREDLVKHQRSYRATPAGKYAQHRQHAKHRGVPFLLTFDEWWGVWKYYWHLKDGTGNLHMCRTNDEGGYELGNVRIDTASNNNRERWGTL